MSQFLFESGSPEATHEIGRRLGSVLTCGHVVALIGPLGSGKTTLVKGLADGTGVTDLRQVNSPTFVIVNEYESGPGGIGLRIYHVDAYRLRGSMDLEALGFDEMCLQGAVVLEWADRVEPLLPVDRLTIELALLGDSRRRLACTAGGPTSKRLLARFSSHR